MWRWDPARKQKFTAGSGVRSSLVEIEKGEDECRLNRNRKPCFILGMASFWGSSIRPKFNISMLSPHADALIALYSLFMLQKYTILLTWSEEAELLQSSGPKSQSWSKMEQVTVTWHMIDRFQDITNTVTNYPIGKCDDSLVFYLEIVMSATAHFFSRATINHPAIGISSKLADRVTVPRSQAKPSQTFWFEGLRH